MFRSLKNRIELQGEFFFFGTLLLLLVLKGKKKHIHSECEISFLCGGRQSASQCPSWLRRCGPAWHLGANAAERWQADSAVVVALRQAIKHKWTLRAYCFDFALFISLNAGGYSAHTDTAECSLADVGIWVQLKQALWIGSRGPKDTEMARWIPYCKRWSHLETKRLHGRRILLPSSLPAPSVKRETLCPTLYRGLTEACRGRERKIVLLKSHSSYALLKLPKKEIHWTRKEPGWGGQHRKIRSPYRKMLACSAVFQMGLKLINCNSLILCDQWKVLGIWV